MKSLPLLLACAVHLSTVAAAARDLEVTFDDGPDGSGPNDGRADLDNLQKPPHVHAWEVEISAVLTGSARRSALSEGRYGRAADFPGGAGSIEASPWTTKQDHAFSLWVRPRNNSTGSILAHGASWNLHFEAGELVFRARQGPGDDVDFPSGVGVPTDGEFHHVALILRTEGSQSRPAVTVDFAPPVVLQIPFIPPPSSEPLLVGNGYDGLLDELVVAQTPGERDLFDFSPTYCVAGTTCIEEVITTTPRAFPHAVPVRFKTSFDPLQCAASMPCPLVFEISGGGKCADDYGEPVDVAALAKAGSVVVTVDLYCEGDGDTNDFPQETSQLIDVKNYVMHDGPYRSHIAGPDYAATGCSHGAGTVHAWAMQEVDDFPRRSFARSTGSAGACVVYSGYLCPEVQAYWEGEMVDLVGTTDPEDPRVRAFHEATDTLSKISDEVVRTREVARSWGASQGEPICAADGTPTCFEEGLWAMHYGSRRFRDLWEKTQPADAPSGYFVEDHGSSCRHCAPASSAAFQCGVCMLRAGRMGMESACPWCLTYDEPTIGHGAPAESCEIPASWYVDPLAAGPSGPDPSAGNGAGGCVATRKKPGNLPTSVVLPLLILLARRTRFRKA